MNGKSPLKFRIIQRMTQESHLAGRMRFSPWLQFLLCVLFLSLLIGFRGTSFSRALDFAFVCFSFAFLAFLSFLIVRARWKRRESLNNRTVQSSEDQGDEMLRRVWRWWTDDQKPG
jgi:ABC-type transport system involved in cytochrome c biogenesis permease subunit